VNIIDTRLLKEAIDDLNEGRIFYDKIQLGAGEYFWDSLIADIESLVVYAGIHRQYYNFYRMLARRFPYAVYYQIDENIVGIVAVLPMRRNPLWIKKQLGKRN
jgi:hypothetical protein